MRSLLAAAVLAAVVGCGGSTNKDNATNPEFVAPTYEPVKRGDPGGPKPGKKP